MYCPDCGAEVPYGAKFCPSCGCAVGDQDSSPGPASYGGYKSPDYQSKVYVNKKSEGLALVLSLLIPGLGEIYVGESGKGAAILVANILCWILGIWLLFPFIICVALWIYAMYDSYMLAKQYNEYLLNHDGNPPPKNR